MDQRALRVRPARVAAVLFGAAALLLGLHAAVQVFVHLSGHDHVFGLVPLFDLDEEANLPTFFASVLLLAGAVLAALVGWRRDVHGRTRRRDWALLGLVVLWMAIDEAAEVHEMLIRPTRELLGAAAAGGVLHFSWVVPGAIVVLALGVAFRGFVRRLGPDRRLLLLAAGLYFGGAIGVELIAGRHVALYGGETLFYRLVLVGLEEGLEMAGAIVLVRMLLGRLARAGADIRLRVVDEARAAAPARRPRLAAARRATTALHPLMSRHRQSPG